MLQELTAFLPMNWVSLAESSRLLNAASDDSHYDSMMNPPQSVRSPTAGGGGRHHPFSHLMMVPKCPHVIAFYDAYTDPDNHSVSMVLEFMNGGTLQVGTSHYQILGREYHRLPPQALASGREFYLGYRLLKSLPIIDSQVSCVYVRLQDVVAKKGAVTDEGVIAWLAYKIVKGLYEIHSKHQIHRDIKPSNILLDSRGNVKVDTAEQESGYEKGTRSTQDSSFILP